MPQTKDVSQEQKMVHQKVCVNFALGGSALSAPKKNYPGIFRNPFLGFVPHCAAWLPSCLHGIYSNTCAPVQCIGQRRGIFHFISLCCCYVCMCACVFSCMQAPMYVPVHTDIGSSPSHSLHCRVSQGLSLNPELTLSGRLAIQPTPETLCLHLQCARLVPFTGITSLARYELACGKQHVCGIMKNNICAHKNHYTQLLAC